MEPPPTTAARMVALWCRDWPIVASGRPVGEPIAVIRAGRVMATSASARVAGVSVGLRRREAQRRCPDVVILAWDEDRDARVFERVVAALESVTHRIEIFRPGVCLFPARGPTRYFGGEVPLTAQVVAEVGVHLPERGALGVGVADGSFAAILAARGSLRRGHPVVVAPGGSPEFLAPLPVEVLADPGPIPAESVGLWQRLGLRRLGELAALGAGDLTARFGAVGTLAHQLASGDELRQPQLEGLPEDMSQHIDLDPPAVSVDQVAFAAKVVADGLADTLSSRGMACTRVRVAIHTESGTVIERGWRDDGSLGSRAIAQRVRWQVDGWLSRPGARSSGGGVTRVVLCPEEVMSSPGRQEGFWGGATEADRRASQAVARVQGILGADAVRVPSVRGGRGAVDRVELVPWDEVGFSGDPTGRPEGAPWPGQIPPPAPALLWSHLPSAELLDSGGRRIAVDGRGGMVGIPQQISIDGGPWQVVVRWAGPWLSDERWWDPVGHRRRARFQVVLDDGSAHLISLESGRWWVEATYD